jgi:hypothetical protein
MIFKKSKLDEPYESGIELFQAIDTTKIIKSLKLEKKGEDNGISNMPKFESEVFDETEQAIVDLMNREKDRVNTTANNNYLAYLTRIQNLNANTKIQEIINFKNKTTAEIKASKIITGGSQLYLLKNEIINLEEKFYEFKKENSLKRPPSFKESKILNISIVLLLLIMESAINSYFFAKGDELGYLGGMIKSTIISLINIGVVGFFFGWLCSRYVVHKNFWKRAFGLFSVLITFASAFGFNWLIAHYRTYYSQALQNAEVLAWGSFTKNTFGIINIESLFLLVIGLFSVVVCVIEFWGAYEHYPGYENAFVKLRDTRNDYLEFKKDFIDEITEIKENGIKNIQNLVEKINGIQREQPMLVAKITSLRVRYEEHLSYLENIGRTLLETYRKANLKARTEPPPNYWNDLWHFETKNKCVFDIPENFKYIDLITDTIKKVGTYVKEIETCYIETVNDLKTLSDLSNTENEKQII